MSKNKIYRAPGARTNTFMTDIKGVSMRPDTFQGQRVNVTALFTSDGVGETLALADPTTKKQLVVPFEEVWALVERARREWREEH